MNKFYEINIVLQWIVAVSMLFVMLLILNFWIELMSESIFGFLLIFIIVPVIQFLVAPFFRLTRLYTYLSPMLLVFAANNRRYDLHNGTSFDYLMIMTNLKSGLRLRQKMLEYYIDGLLIIVHQIENQKISEFVIVRGSSYFFSSRTAERMGFQLSKTNIPEKLNILFNYLDLIWMYSLAHRKFVLPNLMNIKTATTTGKHLLDNKSKLLELKAYLNRNSKATNASS